MVPVPALLLAQYELVDNALLAPLRANAAMRLAQLLQRLAKSKLPGRPKEAKSSRLKPLMQGWRVARGAPSAVGHGRCARCSAGAAAPKAASNTAFAFVADASV